MSKIVSGLCPSCEGDGEVGAPCPERVCARQSTHFIPISEARKALSEPMGVREALIGQFVGDYLIIGRLGRGGFGRVLLGLQRPLYKLKGAIKLIESEHGDKAQQQRALEKFESEASALAVLQSPHIVRMLQFGWFHGRPFLAMEYVPGSRTLQREIDMVVVRQEPLPDQMLRRLVDQILNGLEAAHREGIVHRDIKPDNIMLQDVVGDPWFVKLVDFGLARVQEGNTETSAVLGTLTYMAPEQLEARNIGPWSDLYALGVITFEFFTGVRPFSDRDTQRVISDKLDPNFDPLLAVAHRDIPAEVRAFLARALHRSVEARFRSAQDFRVAWNALFEALGTRRAASTDLSALVGPQRLAELLAAARTGGAAPSSHLGTAPLTDSNRAGSAAPLPGSNAAAGSRMARRQWLWWSATAAVALAALGAAFVRGSGRDALEADGESRAAAGVVESPGLAATPRDDSARPPTPTPPAAPAAPATPATPAPAPPPAAVPASPPPTPPPVETPRSFVVRSRPPGARLRVDGVARGMTPVELQAPPGTRLTLEFEAPGYRTLRHDLDVTADTSAFERQLEPLAVRRTAPPRPTATTKPAAEQPATAKPSLTPVYID